MADLRKKVLWITGASSGIGEALVYSLCDEEVKMIISARRENELKRVKENCPLKNQENIKTLPLDLAKSDELSHKVNEALSFFGRIDILINNAAISQRSLVKETLLSVDRKIMETNFFGTIALSKYLLPKMIENQEGHFANISSLVGKFGTPFRSSYAASKHALHGFYDSMRAELWKDNIKVTMICPGFIKTQVSVNALTGHGEKFNKMDDAQKYGMPAKICAQKMIQAIKKEKEEVYIGGKEKYGVYLKRFFPAIFSKFVRKAKVR
ncbi:SDR family oxidoreductase [Fulvivirgaceae bacterium BMA12]|uniref:SDR family oxidoreductase n=1 Tax=Agaribacillus aureus TaxID=3051825 RepID=A0ABT8L378_9BACT|nr:SDR family oxidoreductase [Fulvivirgaceae bacterium BMA12]